MERAPSLRDCHRACGRNPERAPPSAEAVDLARQNVCHALGIEIADGELHHAASPLRYELFSALAEATEDPDRAPPTWLRDGAPLGILTPIQPGGHFHGRKALHHRPRRPWSKLR